MENNILNIVNLNTEVEGKDILKGFNLKINKGEVHVIMGPNGAGKSTLMNIITDNLNADSGEVLYDGENIKKLGKDYRSVLGYMPQQQGLYHHDKSCGI